MDSIEDTFHDMTRGLVVAIRTVTQIKKEIDPCRRQIVTPELITGYNIQRKPRGGHQPKRERSGSQNAPLALYHPLYLLRRCPSIFSRPYSCIFPVTEM
ncbi:MAG: hypothetical protein K2P39_01740 [Lachnospiraceae bacterium]|nr:hypothetical protein [Lachnospiraceae bacterium]